MSDARKTKSTPTLREKAAALAVMASEVLLMVLEDPAAPAIYVAKLPKLRKPKVAKAPKPTGKPRGRRPMTEEQRAAAKAVREGVVARAGQKAVSEAIAELPRPKPQPVTRASLAAQGMARDHRGNAAADPIVVADVGGLGTSPSSYFTKAG